MADNKTQIVITAKDETRAAIQSAQNGLQQLHAEASKFQFGGLTAGLQQLHAEASKFQFGGLTAGLTVFASGAAFAGAIKGAISFAASLDDMAESTGATVENLSALASVAKTGGHDLDAVALSLQKLGKALHAPDDESKGAAKALDAIGLSVNKLKGQDPAEAMLDIAKALDQFQDGSGKAAVAMAIFGKAGAQLLPFLKDLAEQQKLTGKITAEQAAMAEQYEKNMNRLSAEFGRTSKVLAMEMLPALTRMSTEMYEGIQAAGGFFAALSAGATINPFKNTSENLKTVRAELAEMERVSREDGYTDEQAMNRKRAQLEMLKARQRREALGDNPDANMDANDRKFARKLSLADFVNSEKTGGAGKGKAEKELDALDIAYGGYKGAYKDFVDAIKRKAADAEAAADADVKIEEEHQKRILNVVRETAAYKLDVLQKELQDAAALMEEGAINEDQWAEFAQVRIDAFNKVKDSGVDAFKELQQAIEGWGKASADAFVEFAFTGKTSFSDMVTSILKDLAKMVVYQNITKPLASGLSEQVSSGGFGDFFKGIFGGGRATGGPVSPGQYYVVGENGPEVLVPNTAGTVIPSGGGMGGGSTSNVVINIDAAGTRTEGDAGNARELGRRIEAAVRGVLMVERRPGGMLA